MGRLRVRHFAGAALLAATITGLALAGQPEMIERNLFAPDRKAPAPARPDSVEKPDARNSPLQLDAVIIIGPGRQALVSYIGEVPNKAGKKAIIRKWVRQGDSLDTGHVVRSIEPTRIELVREGEASSLELHGDKQLAPPLQEMPKQRTPQPDGTKNQKAS